jgi:hypothetical protein
VQARELGHVVYTVPRGELGCAPSCPLPPPMFADTPPGKLMPVHVTPYPPPPEDEEDEAEAARRTPSPMPDRGPQAKRKRRNSP